MITSNQCLSTFLPTFLLPYQHLPCCSEISCCERIEIDAARHRFTEFASAMKWIYEPLSIVPTAAN